jgi:chemotaxis protein CheD
MNKLYNPYLSSHGVAIDRIVGIGEYIISNCLDDVIKTFALGSCVALTAYCEKSKVGGMIHMALPNSTQDQQMKPGYFVSEGIPNFFHDINVNYGCDLKDLTIGVFGGICLQEDDYFQIGKKNIEMTKSIIREMGLRFTYNQTGGNLSRTLYLEVNTGEISIRTQPMTLFNQL